MLSLSDYIVSLIEEQKKKVKREIRLAKLEVKQLDKFIYNFRNMSDSEIEDALADSEEVLAEYRDLRKKVEEVENSELKKLVRTGKLREVYYDKDGNELNIDSNQLESDGVSDE